MAMARLSDQMKRLVAVGSFQCANARLQRAADLLQRRGGKGLSMAALSSGYFDQAHMNHDFRVLAGVPPFYAAAAAPTGSILPIRSLLSGPSYRDGNRAFNELQATANCAVEFDPPRVLQSLAGADRD